MDEVIFDRINKTLIDGNALNRLQIIKKAYSDGKDVGDVHYGLKELKDALEVLIKRKIIVPVEEREADSIVIQFKSTYTF